MIHSKDLRIGNLVYVENCSDRINGKMFIFVVNGIFENSTRVKNIKEPGSDIEIDVTCDNVFLQPIALTPEVLEKTGFILMNRVTQRFKKYINETDSECICLELSEVGNNKPYRVMYDYNAGTYLKRKVPYLHDLQNLYHSLTGTELTLNLCTATTQNGDL